MVFMQNLRLQAKIYKKGRESENWLINWIWLIKQFSETCDRSFTEFIEWDVNKHEDDVIDIFL